MSLLAIIEKYSDDYSVTRTDEGSYTQGRYTPGNQTVIIVRASIQSQSGRDEQTLRDAEHAEETRMLWCAQELFPRSPGHESDVFMIDGEPWEVKKVEYFPHRTTGFWRATIARQVLP